MLLFGVAALRELKERGCCNLNKALSIMENLQPLSIAKALDIFLKAYLNRIGNNVAILM